MPRLRVPAKGAGGLPFLAALILPFAAAAHTGHGDPSGFLAGFGHPFAGLDHLLAMLGVGLWAMQMQAAGPRSRAVWLLPLGFVLPMAAGFGIALLGLPVPGIEQGIALSVLALGLAVALSLRPPMPLALTAVGLFALCHGHAHGSELPEAGLAVGYAAGMLLATGLLHLAGIAAALAANRQAWPLATRAAGAAIALAGAALVF